MKFLKKLTCSVVVLAVLTGFLSSVSAATFSQKELAYLPANVQIELFKRGVITPVDMLNAQMDEFLKTNKIVHAATVTDYDDAMMQAKASTERYKNGTYRALEGITVGVKDEHCV